MNLVKEMILHIKNMVCPRCIMAVKDVLKEQGLEVQEVNLGYAVVSGPGENIPAGVETGLRSLGFELLEDPELQLTEQIKLKVQEYLRLTEENKINSTLSAFLTESLHKNYSALSKHFAQTNGQTIENYSIRFRIERVKELLNDTGLNVSQIADKLNYSSVHYLSGQFKKVTGLSISDYRNQTNGSRKPLDQV